MRNNAILIFFIALFIGGTTGMLVSVDSTTKWIEADVFQITTSIVSIISMLAIGFILYLKSTTSNPK